MPGSGGGGIHDKKGALAQENSFEGAAGVIFQSLCSCRKSREL